MSGANRETAMIHYVCNVCHMAATIVETPAGVLAWLDHMENHADSSLYDSWTWTAVQLPLS